MEKYISQHHHSHWLGWVLQGVGCRGTQSTQLDQAVGSIYAWDSRVDRHHLIISPDSHSIIPYAWTYLCFLRFHQYMQFVCLRAARYPVVSSHALLMLLEPESLFLTNFQWMPPEVSWTVDNNPLAVGQWHFASQWSSKFGNAIPAWDQINLEMNLAAAMEWVQRYIWRPWWPEHGGRNSASVEMQFESTIV